MNINSLRFQLIVFALLAVVLALPAGLGGESAGGRTGASLAGSRGLKAQAILGPDSPDLVADVSIVKSASPDPVIAGESLAYTLTASNNDPADATNVLITDTLPLSVTFLSASPGCSYASSSHQVGCSLPILPMTSTTALTLSVGVDPAASGDLVNQAVISHDDLDPNLGNNTTGPVTTAVATSADLAIGKSASSDSVAPGDPLDYTLTITNTGPSVAAAVLITDSLPSNVTFLSASPPCSYAPGPHQVTCSLASSDVASSTDLSVSVVVDPDASGDLVNQAVISHDDLDPNLGNNTTGPVTTAVIASADLSLDQSDSSDPVTAGTPLTYTLTMTNPGPSVAAGVLLTDTLPGGVTFSSATPDSCAHTAGTVTCDLGNLQAEGSIAVEIVVNVNSATMGTLVNSAIATAGGSDPNPGNNTSTETTQVGEEADLTIQITDIPDPVIAGQDILTYTIVVDNLGPSSASSFIVVDSLPSGVTFSQILIPATDCSYVSASHTVICNIPNLDAGAGQLIKIKTVVDPDAPATLTNNASVINEGDPDESNNDDSEPTQVLAISDLALAGGDFPDPVTAGAPLTYTLTVDNIGPSTAAQTVLTADLPAEVNLVSATTGQGSCNESGGVVTCDLGDLDPGGGTGVEIVSTVDPAYDGLLSAEITVSSNSTDPVPGDNTITLDTTSQVLADLLVEKSGSPQALPPGASLTYSLVIENLGPSDAAGIVITDTLPAEVSVILPLPPNCSGASVVSCSLSALGAGGVVTTTLAVQVDPEAPLGTITNTAVVDSASTDPNQANNSAVETTIVADEVVDLSLSALGSEALVLPGDILTYTLSVANAGPSAATGVVVTDMLPPGVTLLGAGASQGSCGASDPVVCSLGSLLSGANAAVTIVVSVDSDAPDLLINTAEASAAEADANSANDLDSVETTVFVVTWIAPVAEGQVHYAGNEMVQLVMDVTPLVAVESVEFRRWDTDILDWVVIGVDDSAPYQASVDTTTLHFTWNEIRAQAIDGDGKFSLAPRIWIYRLYSQFAPLVAKMAP